MEFRRFDMLRVERLSSPRVREKLWFACSLKMRSEVVRFAIVVCPGRRGSAGLSAIALARAVIQKYARRSRIRTGSAMTEVVAAFMSREVVEG